MIRALGGAATSVLLAVTAACSGRESDSSGVRNKPHLVTRRDAAQEGPRDARNAVEIETGALTGATENAIPCPSWRGLSNRSCFAVAHGPFVLTDLEAFAYTWYPTQTQAFQEVIAFPGPPLPELPPAFAPRWQTQASEYWGSGWKTPAGDTWNSGLPRIHRDLRAVHGARYFIADGEALYVSVTYRGCWKGEAFERDRCSPGSVPEISATFSGYHGK